MSNAVKVNAYYRLRKSVALTTDCLNESVAFSLLGYNAILRLPGLTWNSDDDPIITAPIISKVGIANLKHYSDFYHFWGSVDSWQPKDKTFSSFRISGLLLELDLNPSKITYSNYLHGRGHPESSEITELGEQIDDWFDEFYLWVSVLTKQDLNYKYPRKSVSMPGNGLKVWTEEDDITSLIASHDHISINIDTNIDKQALTKMDLTKIILAINSDKRPTEGHILLRDARDASARGEMRKAAIDAGTAVEVVLRNYALSNNILTRPREMLSWYVDNTAPGLPEDTQTNLVKVRNDAAHLNATFDVTIVPRSIEVATQIVEMLEPISI